jgi:hypothetical protein
MNPRIGIMIKILLYNLPGPLAVLEHHLFCSRHYAKQIKESSDLLRNIFMEDFVVEINQVVP